MKTFNLALLSVSCILLALSVACLIGSENKIKNIDSTYINSNGELIIVYNTGEKENVGKVVGEEGKDGTDGKEVYVCQDCHKIPDYCECSQKEPVPTSVTDLMTDIVKVLEGYNSNTYSWKRFVNGTNSQAYRLELYHYSAPQEFSYYTETYNEAYFTTEVIRINKLLPTYIKGDNIITSTTNSDINNNVIYSMRTSYYPLQLNAECRVELSFGFGLWYYSNSNSYYSLHFTLTHASTNCLC